MHTDNQFYPISDSRFSALQSCFSFDEASRILTVGICYDNNLKKRYHLGMKGKLTTGNSFSFTLIDVTLRDRCYLEYANPIGTTGFITYRLLTTPGKVTDLGSYFNRSPNHTGCFNYELYDGNNPTTIITYLEEGITFDSASQLLTIASTMPQYLGTMPKRDYYYKVGAKRIADGTLTQADFYITIEHECTDATVSVVTPAPNLVNVDYYVLKDSEIIEPIPVHFNFAQSNTAISCFSFRLS